MNGGRFWVVREFRTGLQLFLVCKIILIQLLLLFLGCLQWLSLAALAQIRGISMSSPQILKDTVAADLL